jgi:hypothetical protein
MIQRDIGTGGVHFLPDYSYNRDGVFCEKKQYYAKLERFYHQHAGAHAVVQKDLSFVA